MEYKQKRRSKTKIFTLLSVTEVLVVPFAQFGELQCAATWRTCMNIVIKAEYFARN